MKEIDAMKMEEEEIKLKQEKNLKSLKKKKII